MPRKTITKNRRGPLRKSRRYAKKASPRKRTKTLRTKGTLVSKPSFGGIYQPFPPNLFTALTYSERFTLNQLVGGTPGVQTFRANSLYDPNLTGVGHQPRYFDTLCGADGTAAPYSHYRVHACKIKLTVWAFTDVSSYGTMVAIIPRESTASTVDSFEEMSERAYSRTRALGTQYAKTPITMKHFVKNKVLLGHKDLQDVDECAATYNNNPSEQVYIDVAACNIDPNNVITVNCSIQLVYFVQFFGLNDVADS